MNILPKKRWHVRTKENIARVRRDEALAAEQAKIEQARIDKAESEARINFLRNESRQKNNIDSADIIESTKKPSQSSSSKHINFFEELEQGNIDYSRPNKDYEKDKKEEQEKYEKQIGYLTYLGQGIKEAVSSSWYNELPKRVYDPDKNIEVKPNKKARDDPMQDIKRYLHIIKAKQEIDTKPDISQIKAIDSHTKTDSNKFKYESVISGIKRKRNSSVDTDEDDHKSRKKHKKHKKHKKSKKHKKEKEKESKGPSVDIQKLRAERLEREKQERLKAQQLLAELKEQESNSQSGYKQKYNSQFFPQLARQNCEKSKR